MNTLQELLLNYQKPEGKIKSERAEIIRQFFEELKEERRFDNMRAFLKLNRQLRQKGQVPLTPKEFKKRPEFFKQFRPSYIGWRTAHIPTQDLYYFLSICRDAKVRSGSFGKCFFGALKVKK